MPGVTEKLKKAFAISTRFFTYCVIQHKERYAPGLYAVEEGHGWTLVETRLDFWGRVEKFLQKHIGQGSE
jgi:hypothetical protein